jgi:methylated-DNA-[protein]-cysteine S-methyltransferase
LIEISSLKQGGVWFALALDTNKKMIACAFSEESKRKAEAAVLASAAPRDRPVHKATFIDKTRFRALYDLYMGRGRTDLGSLDLSHVSPFRRKVYLLLWQIPRGRATTYGTIAKKLGSRSYARAVGTANSSNPMPLAIPCHRVIRSTLKVGYYGLPGREPWEGSDVKRQLLVREGVRFRDGKITKESLWAPN